MPKMNPSRLSFVLAAAAFLISSLAQTGRAQQVDIPGPEGSGSFGSTVTVLPNGNYVVTDPEYSIPGGFPAVGAVYLYNGSANSLISVMHGSFDVDEFGSGGIVVLTNGNFVILSPAWGQVSHGGPVGAVTFCSAVTGCSGTVDLSNSLVGSTAFDGVSNAVALQNGNYLVVTPNWDDSANGRANVGAVTLCNGITGCTGAVSASRSLIGSTAQDQVGIDGIVTLTNGNFLVKSSLWDNPVSSAANAGAVTWCRGDTGCAGVVSATNSVVGSSVDDQVGIRFSRSVVELSNGSYVIASPFWDNGNISDVGAVTLCAIQTGCNGPLDPTNSLTGSLPLDKVGYHGIVPLVNGNYVVISPEWDNQSIVNAGAITFCSGSAGCTGNPNTNNSLIGKSQNDGDELSATALPNGKYTAQFPNWSNTATGTQSVGAVTLCDGSSGCIGEVSAVRSLIGGTTRDGFWSYVTALPNGNYTVIAGYWDDPETGNAEVGAVTFCSGQDGCTGLVSISNSSIGSRPGDGTVFMSAQALANGNYVLTVPFWDDPQTNKVNVGAVRWCSGTTGCVGRISAANSLVGSTAGDQLGNGYFASLSNGNYVVGTPDWDNPVTGIQNVGAVSFCDGRQACIGPVTPNNSLIGENVNESLGNGGIRALPDGNYLVASGLWDRTENGVGDARAVTLGNGFIGTTGAKSSAVSIVGNNAAGLLGYDYDALRYHVLAGRAENVLTILTPNSLQAPLLTVSDSLGNGNGIPDPGERLTLSIPLLNNTRSTATNAVLQVDGGNPVVYGTISEGQTVTKQVSFTVPQNAACGSVLSLNIGVNSSIGPISLTRTLIIGAPVNTFSENFDGVTAPALPASWTTANVGNGINFVTVSSSSDTTPNSAFAANSATAAGETTLTSPSIPISSQAATVTFRHRFDTEADWDGGVLEISINGGAFADIIAAGGSFISNGYNSVMAAARQTGTYMPNPLNGRAGWVGNSGGFITTKAQLPASAAGQNVQLRWRFGADNNTTGQGPNPGWYVDTIKVFGSHNCVNALSRRTPFDFDGDGKTDVSIFRPGASAEWWISSSSDSGVLAAQFGAAGDLPVAADYTGDGKADMAFFRPSTGTWFVLRSEDFSFYGFPFGDSADVPAPADYDGDGKADSAVFRSGAWYILRSSDNGVTTASFGVAGDRPVPADYDGDGKADIGIYRPNGATGGEWWIQRTTAGLFAASFGSANDKTTVGDWTGDGKADCAFFRPSTGTWYVLRSEDQSFFGFPFGNATDQPAPGDYDGDGKTDAAVFRPGGGAWFLNRSTAGPLSLVFGADGDQAVPNIYVR